MQQPINTPITLSGSFNIAAILPSLHIHVIFLLTHSRFSGFPWSLLDVLFGCCFFCFLYPSRFSITHMSMWDEPWKQTRFMFSCYSHSLCWYHLPCYVGLTDCGIRCPISPSSTLASLLSLKQDPHSWHCNSSYLVFLQSISLIIASLSPSLPLSHLLKQHLLLAESLITTTCSTPTSIVLPWFCSYFLTSCMTF